MKQHSNKTSQAMGAKWGEIGEALLFALILIFIFVVLNGMGGQ